MPAFVEFATTNSPTDQSARPIPHRSRSCSLRRSSRRVDSRVDARITPRTAASTTGRLLAPGCPASVARLTERRTRHSRNAIDERRSRVSRGGSRHRRATGASLGRRLTRAPARSGRVFRRPLEPLVAHEVTSDPHPGSRYRAHTEAGLTVAAPAAPDLATSVTCDRRLAAGLSWRAARRAMRDRPRRRQDACVARMQG
jgi:hypothetical protein